jgi:hypothetical protein
VKNLIRVAFVLVVASLLGACGGGGGDAAAGADTGTTPAVASLAVFELDVSTWDDSAWQ